MKKITTFLLCAAPLGYLTAQLELNTTAGTFFKNTATTIVKIDVGGVDNTGNIDNAGTIYLDLNYSQTGAGAYTGGASSWLWFEGSANQTMLGVGNPNIARIRVDNGNRLQLLSNIQANTDVDLRNNGSIELGNFNLSCAGGNIVNYDINHYVITNGTGTLQRDMAAGQTKVYPVGNSTYNPATLTANAGHVAEVMRIRVRDQILVSGTAGANETTHHVNRTWDINEAVAGGSNINLTVEWDASQELPLFNRPLCLVKHWDGAAWNLGAFAPATLVGGTRWSRTRSNQTLFSPFGVIDNVTLPIELLDFTARRNTIEDVQLDWHTASELNNRGFEVQRRLDNETTFTTIAWVDGHGTTVQEQAYQLHDNNAYAGTSYYQLKQVDFDGSYSYSPLRAVEGKTNPHAITMFPNPTTGDLHIRFNLELDQQKAQITVYALDGKRIYDTRTQIQANQLMTLSNLHELPAATYILRITLDSGETYTQKFEKITP